MDERYEYCVVTQYLGTELHRGPYETFEEAQQWIFDVSSDGYPEAFTDFYVAERKVSGWYRVDE